MPGFSTADEENADEEEEVEEEGLGLRLRTTTGGFSASRFPPNRLKPPKKVPSSYFSRL
jgi:hypothetical protein